MAEIIQLVEEHRDCKVMIGLPGVGKESIIERLASSTDDWVSLSSPSPQFLSLSLSSDEPICLPHRLE